MNIFVLSKNPQKAAQFMCDKHVVKMTLESAQLLCSAFSNGTAPYRQTHYNHPCSIWTRESEENYSWLIKHGLALANEYTFRFNKKHKSQQVIEWCANNVSQINFPQKNKTTHALAMPDVYKNGSAVESYRRYYLHEKKDIAQWKHARKKPYWW